MALAFIDANVIVYMYGRPHPYREPCEEILRFAASKPTNFRTSAEVLQELLNLGIRRGSLETASQMMRTLANSCGEVVSVLGDDVFRAVDHVYSGLSARDRIHLAVVERLGITHIVSTDRSFDGVPGITRLDPLDFEAWRDQFAEGA